MERALRRRSPRSCATLNHVADRFDLRRDIRFNTRVDGGHVRRGARAAGTSTTDQGDDVSAQLPRHGRRLPVDVQDARDPRHRRLPGQLVPHRSLAPRGRRLHRPARRRHRHRVVGDPVDPDHRRAGRPPDRVPAHAELQPSRPRTRRSTRRSSPTRQGALPTSTASRPPGARVRRAVRGTEVGAGGQPTRSARPATRQAWRGGQPRSGSLLVYNDLISTRRPTTRRRVRPAADPRDRRRPRGRREARARDHPFGTKRPLPRHRLLRHVQPPTTCTLVDLRTTPLDRDHATRGPHRATSEYEFDVIVFATGFDAMTGSLTAIDIAGPRRRATLQGEVGRTARARTSGVADRRVPQPVHDHRARAARRCSRNMMISIEQHVDWIADAIDAPAPTDGQRRIEADRRGRGRLGRPRQRGRRHDAVPAGQLLVHGRQRARQAAGVHALHRRRRRLPRGVRRRRRQGYDGFTHT